MSATVFNDLSPRIQKLLRERYGHFSTTAVHNWQWIFDGDDDDEPKRHVVTIFTRADWDLETWLQAAKEIHSLLLSSGLPAHITVELINGQQLSYKKITAECVPEADRMFYSNIQKTILKILVDEMQTSLVYIGLYMYSEASSISKTPCLFVFVKPGSVFNWESLSAQLYQVLPEHFKLQFRPGRYVPLAAEDGLPIPRELDPGLRSGASISRMDDDICSGTSGIFFDLKVDQRPPPTPFNLTPGVYKTLATCHHIIAPLKGTPDYHDALKHGYPLPSSPQESPQIVCPSHQHVRESIRMLEANIAADLKDLESSSDRTFVTTLRSEIKTLQKQLQSCRQLLSRVPVGKLLFSTMHVRNDTHCRNIDPHDCWFHDHFILDIALIQLTTHNPPSNEAPSASQGRPTLWSDVRRGVKGIAQPEYGMKVFKCGAQSHVTSGVLSGQSWFFTDEVGWFEGWSICCLGERRFCIGGDSAAAVTTLSSAELVGQLHGQLVDPAGEQISCMIPMQPITNFIEAQIPESELTLSTDTPSAVTDSPFRNVRKILNSIGSRLFWKEQDGSMV
ncbi:MAG: hypothetical protein Q9208_006804 [Pyrenodesmia sp. 3 TL-2023]